MRAGEVQQAETAQVGKLEPVVDQKQWGFGCPELGRAGTDTRVSDERPGERLGPHEFRLRFEGGPQSFGQAVEMAHVADSRTEGMPVHRNVERERRNLVTLQQVGEKATAGRGGPLTALPQPALEFGAQHGGGPEGGQLLAHQLRHLLITHRGILKLDHKPFARECDVEPDNSRSPRVERQCGLFEAATGGRRHPGDIVVSRLGLEGLQHVIDDRHHRMRAGRVEDHSFDHGAVLLEEGGERLPALECELAVGVFGEVGGKGFGRREQAELVGGGSVGVFRLEDAHLQLAFGRADLRHDDVIVTERLTDRRDILGRKSRGERGRSDLGRAVDENLAASVAVSSAPIVSGISHGVSPRSAPGDSKIACARPAASKSAAPSNSPRSVK